MVPLACCGGPLLIASLAAAGEAAVRQLLEAGRRVAVVEQELIGGECAYWACIPSERSCAGPRPGRKPAWLPG